MARYASIEECRAYYAGNDAEQLDVAIVQGAAARTVSALSTPELDADGNATIDYAEAARETELLVGKWVWRTDGATLTSKTITGVVAKTYAKVADVQALASSSLGIYYKDPAKSGRAARSVPLFRG